MSLPTASAWPRIMACPASAALPNEPTPDNFYSEAGTAIDEYTTRIAGGMTPAESLEKVPDEHRAACLALDLDALPMHLRHQVGMAYDMATGKAREIPPRDKDGYRDLKPFEIACTSDVVGLAEDAAFIGDYKNGHRYVPRPAANAQLLIGALCATRIWDKARAVMSVTLTKDPENIRNIIDEVDVFDLLDFEERLRAKHDEVIAIKARLSRGEPIDVTPGEHCVYCPAMHVCPDKVRAMQRIESGDMARDVEVGWVNALTPQSAPEAYRQYETVRSIYKRMSDILHAYGREHDIDLGDGRIFGARTTRESERIDNGKRAAQAVAELFGDAVADAASSVTMTKTSLTAALKAHVPKGQATQATKQAMAAIKLAGATKTAGGSVKVEEYRPRKNGTSD